METKLNPQYSELQPRVPEWARVEQMEMSVPQRELWQMPLKPAGKTAFKWNTFWCAISTWVLSCLFSK